MKEKGETDIAQLTVLHPSFPFPFIFAIVIIIYAQ